MTEKVEGRYVLLLNASMDAKDPNETIALDFRRKFLNLFLGLTTMCGILAVDAKDAYSEIALGSPLTTTDTK